MAAETANYGLKKPSAEDFYNIEDFNWNADVIDAELAKRAELGEDGRVPAAQLRPWILTRRAAPRRCRRPSPATPGTTSATSPRRSGRPGIAKPPGDHTHTAAQVGRCPRPGR